MKRSLFCILWEVEEEVEEEEEEEEGVVEEG